MVVALLLLTPEDLVENSHSGARMPGTAIQVNINKKVHDAP